MEEVKHLETKKWVVGLVVMEAAYKDQIEREENYQLLCKMLDSAGMYVQYVRPILKHNDDLQETLISMVEELKVDLVLTLGGVGLSKQDNVPELTAAMVDVEVPALVEAFRYYGLNEAIKEVICRGTAGVRRKTLIMNLPQQILQTQKALLPTLTLIRQSLMTIHK